MSETELIDVTISSKDDRYVIFSKKGEGDRDILLLKGFARNKEEFLKLAFKFQGLCKDYYDYEF